MRGFPTLCALERLSQELGGSELEPDVKAEETIEHLANPLDRFRPQSEPPAIAQRGADAGLEGSEQTRFHR